MKKIFFLRVLSAVAASVLFTAVAAVAQPGSGGPGPGSPAASVPIDGGASLLLAGGIGYAVRRLRQRRAK